MANVVGPARCPVCNSAKARLTVSKQNLVVLTCNTCNCQVFARSDRSDELLRARLVTAGEPAASPAAASAPAKPAAPEVKEGVREGEPAPIPAAPKKKTADVDWGL